MKYISRSVWILSLVSLFTDTASEMLYPIMPIYLQSIGFSIVLIGVLEGVAEATAGISKGYFGKLSDTTGRRVPFVRIGYTLSAISKPMMAMFLYPLWIFFARTVDRFGKGIRTGARDAMLSDEATSQTKGKVFGFHRSMDTLGAVLGPTFALAYLAIYPEHYRSLFLIAFIPGLIAVISTYLLKDKKRPETRSKKSTPFFSFLKYWKPSPTQYKKLMVGLIAFSLFNSSDLFLILRAKEVGIEDTHLIALYIFYNLVYAIFAFPVGMLADKIGLKKIYMIGLLLFAVVYFGMSVNTNFYFFIGLFFLYGIYASATEGISKAWITNITDPSDTATAIGTFSALQSISALIASSLAGLIWYQFGATAAFLTTAIITLVILFYISRIPYRVIK